MNEPTIKTGASSPRDGAAKFFECQVRSRTESGPTKIISTTAASKEDVIQRLLAQGYVVVSVKQASVRGQKGQGPAAQSGRSSGFSFGKKVSLRELVFFANQLSTLLKAGIPLIRSLEIIEKSNSNALFRNVLSRLRKRISEGGAFTVALREQGNVFPWVWINLVEVGEMTGKLPECLDEIAQYQESSARIKGKVTTAFFYPGILTAAVTGALVFLLAVIVPKFETIFAQQNMELPGLTKVIIFASNVVRHQFLLVVLIVVAISLLLYFLGRSPKHRVSLDAFLLGMPIFGELSMQVSVVRFSRSLGTLLRAGVPILQSLEIGGRLVENKFLEGHIARVAEAVKGGQGLGVQLEARKVFPVFMTQLLTTGEESGQLDRFLTLIANYYEESVDTFLARLTVLLEPFLLVFMGGVIGTIVVSMFLPIIELASGAGVK